MSPHSQYRHWQLEYDAQRIAWLTINRCDEDINSLSTEVLQELEHIITEVEQNPPEGLVISSSKASGFVAGADIREFDQQTDLASATESVQYIHQLLNRLETLPCTTIAAIHGFCLGGGLELALACDYRIALNTESTMIGFPEIKLGIFPGFGGTARAIRNLGGFKAMGVILAARIMKAKAAKSAGLIDQLVSRHGSLRWSAYKAVIQKRKSKPSRLQALTSVPGIRQGLAWLVEREIAKKARKDHYPAPYALIDLWRSVGSDFDALLQGEATEVPKLLLGETSTNLRRVFHLQELLKEQGKADKDTQNWQPRRVHVVGAGVMGGDIAAWCALKGFEVTLQDREMQYIEPALKRAKKLFSKKLKAPAKVAAANSRLIADLEGNGVANADVIIEAIFENLEAKQTLFKTLEQAAKPSAILASNTSAIPLEEIASEMQNPERLIGLHFFNPVAMMPLVEVVRSTQSSTLDIKKGCIFSGRIGKFPLPVKSAPGFLVNRILSPYMLEALTLRAEGHSIETIDAAAETFGMPMGPVELIDTVGLDVGLNVAKELSPDKTDAIGVIEKLVTGGKLGKKSGEGFYRWEKGKPQKSAANDSASLAKLGQRLIQPLLDECQSCLDENIVENADLIDAGVIFGTGFAPFRGGPLHYVSQANQNNTEATHNE